jgi:signal transduction histidine kinase
MLRRHALAPLQGLVLFGLALVGLAQVAVAVVVSFTGVLTHYELERWLPNLCRRLAHAWLGVSIAEPYRPKPPPAVPERDGWYRDGNQLYRSKVLVNYKRRYEWLHRDPATHRDHLWELVTPVTGGLAAVLPAGLIVAGFLLPLWATIPLVALGFAAGPAMLRLWGRWTAMLLAPHGRTGRSPVWQWITSRARMCLLLAGTAGMSLLGLAYAAAYVVAIYPGIFAPLPPIIRITRTYVNFRREQIARWTGVEIEEPYLPPPLPPAPRPDGKYQFGRRLHDSPTHPMRTRILCAALKDKATWRDLAWLVLDPVLTILCVGLPVLAGTIGFAVYFWSWVWSLPLNLWIDLDVRRGWAYLGDLFPGLRSLPDWVSPAAGLLVSAAVLALAPFLLKAHSLWSRSLLSPTRSAELVRRVAHLTETRSDATDTQAAELRRIERDLHDGAQARWVAMGLNLGAVEQLIDRDPEAAKRLLANARNASAEALVELRQLVQGIHPPVLAERGLGDAVRALALDSALDVHVAVDLPGRLADPVEAAMYFAISELLTNVAKHAHAERVSVDIRYVNERLRVSVADDGRGGADPQAGSGLQGVRRRLATFDGVLVLHSPVGGPTTATMEMPCALSSPRTSTSSETA